MSYRKKSLERGWPPPLGKREKRDSIENAVGNIGDPRGDLPTIRNVTISW